ncbi:MAG: ABC transporter permease [Planctomycetales bacterium]|nr:ABC transporter permease [Planctomycetales bacterium]
MKTLHVKFWRELFEIKSQAAAIAAVVAAGVAVFVMSLSTLEFLRSTRDTYYDRYRFADVFATVRRAPNSIVARLEKMEGVANVDTRVVADVTLDVPGLLEPATGRLISWNSKKQSSLNTVYLRSGRFPEADAADEVVVSEAFFEANLLRLGDTLSAILNGRLQKYRIVGVGLSPEYVFQIRPGDIMPDPKRFSVLWASANHLEAAFDMQGAFNDVSLRTLHAAQLDEILDGVDRLLNQFGCSGAYARKDQLSASFLNEELKQLEGMAVVAPAIFLGVAAFLLNVVLIRRIGTQREIIATLKAFGFDSWTISWHYAFTAILIALVGTLLGIVVGLLLAKQLANLYAEFYRFPQFTMRIHWQSIGLAFATSLAASLLGSMRAVYSLLRMMPAEAMRPAAPSRYRRSVVERLGLTWLMPLSVRMILRQVERRPLSSLFSVLGIAAAAAILLMGNFSPDAIDYLINFQFRTAQRHDIQVTFKEDVSREAIFDLQHLPGVQAVEALRIVPVKLKNKQHERRTAIMGLGDRRDLFRLLDANERPIRLPPSGLVLSDSLANLLDVSVGQFISVEVMQGQRPVLQLPVVGVSREYVGLNAYCDEDYLHHQLHESRIINGGFLSVDSLALEQLYDHLKRMPRIASVLVKQATIDQFIQTIGENLFKFQVINIIFASIIAVGVVYNTARVALDERCRELSTLRVIGFSRWEVSTLLLGELALLTFIAIPVGLGIGFTFCYAMVQGFESLQFRIPLAIRPASFALVTVITLLAAAASSVVVWIRLQQIKIVEVLKSRE